ncbi:Uu.00g135280.m01.CDS01 [Anthostomella pinea]|uniref:Uu.00g135280.m01.CDS01 n=1 Tax=Anthostomella pinea TaxID=933095 RepID=A0AAI8VQ17_9PEZI|nr:Uu.00g135280.m01.CDS01 [Anthostomella pinea]
MASLPDEPQAEEQPIIMATRCQTCGSLKPLDADVPERGNSVSPADAVRSKGNGPSKDETKSPERTPAISSSTDQPDSSRRQDNTAGVAANVIVSTAGRSAPSVSSNKLHATNSDMSKSARPAPAVPQDKQRLQSVAHGPKKSASGTKPESIETNTARQKAATVGPDPSDRLLNTSQPGPVRASIPKTKVPKAPTEAQRVNGNAMVTVGRQTDFHVAVEPVRREEPPIISKKRRAQDPEHEAKRRKGPLGSLETKVISTLAADARADITNREAAANRGSLRSRVSLKSTE